MTKAVLVIFLAESLASSVYVQDEAPMRFRKGWTSYKAGNFKEAVEHLSYVIEKDPKHHLAYYWRGKAKVAMNQFESALQDFNKVIELQNDHAPTYVERGNVYKKLNKPDKAEENWKRAGELDPFWKDITKPSKDSKKTEFKPTEDDYTLRVVNELKNAAKNVKDDSTITKNVLGLLKEVLLWFKPLQSNNLGQELAKSLNEIVNTIKPDSKLDNKLAEKLSKVLDGLAKYLYNELQREAQELVEKSLLDQALIIIGRLKNNDKDIRRQAANDLADFVPRLRGKDLSAALKVVSEALKGEKDTVVKIHLEAAVEKLNSQIQLDNWVNEWLEHLRKGGALKGQEKELGQLLDNVGRKELEIICEAFLKKAQGSDNDERKEALEWLRFILPRLDEGVAYKIFRVSIKLSEVKDPLICVRVLLLLADTFTYLKGSNLDEGCNVFMNKLTDHSFVIWKNDSYHFFVSTLAADYLSKGPVHDYIRRRDTLQKETVSVLEAVIKRSPEQIEKLLKEDANMDKIKGVRFSYRPEELAKELAKEELQVFEKALKALKQE